MVSCFDDMNETLLLKLQEILKQSLHDFLCKLHSAQCINLIGFEYLTNPATLITLNY